MVENGHYTRSPELAYTVLSGVMEYALDLEQMEVNPLARVAMLKATRRRVAPPEVEQVQDLLRLVGEEDHYPAVFLSLASCTGMSVGEMIVLRWENANLDEGYLLVVGSVVRSHSEGMRSESAKTDQGARRIDLDGRMLELLDEHKRRQDVWQAVASTGYIYKWLVLPDTDGGWPRPQNMLRHQKELGGRVGICGATDGSKCFGPTPRTGTGSIGPPAT